MKKTLILIAVILCVYTPTAHAQNAGIAVIVNDDVISSSDINDRLKLIMVSSGFPNTPEVIQNLIPQIKNALIEEKIQMQEAQKENITVENDEIIQGFAQIAAQNNIPPDQFMAMMQQTGINPATLKNQIRAQLGWSKVVQKALRSKINVNQNDINAFVERIKTNIGENEYLLSEIVIGVQDPKKEQEALNFAVDLTEQIRTGKAPFPKMAQQFSKSAGAMNGGDLGWMQASQLDEKIAETIAKMDEKTISPPIRTTEGYHIVLLRAKRQITEEGIPDRKQIEMIIGNQRLERMQAHYLNDLKSSAYIDSRV